MAMTSNKPYLVKAFYDWIVDNNCTPYIVVNALEEGVEVPQDYVTDGQIVLNLSPVSVKSLSMTLESISFNARFAGVPMSVMVPIPAIMGIYAKENGQGMIFQQDLPTDPDPGGKDKKTPKVVSDSGKDKKPQGPVSLKKPSLHIVK